MSFVKKELEKIFALQSSATTFLKEYHFVEEALDGKLCTKYYSDNSEIYKCASFYYKKNNFKNVFSLIEFRDEIKHIIDTCELSSAIEYDSKRLDK